MTNTEIQIQRPLAILASDDAVQGGSGRAGQPRRPLPPPTIIQRRPSSPVYGSIPYYIYGIILHMCKYSLYVCKSILCISSCQWRTGSQASKEVYEGLKIGLLHKNGVI